MYPMYCYSFSLIVESLSQQTQPLGVCGESGESVSNRSGRSLRFAVALILAACHTGTAASNSDWNDLRALRTGQETRITLNNGTSYRGSFQSMNETAMVVQLTTGQQSFAKGDVVRVATRGERHRGRNALIGALVGGGVGAGIGAAVDAHQNANSFIKLNVATPILGAIGLLAGTAVGFFASGSGWHEVYRAR